MSCARPITPRMSHRRRSQALSVDGALDMRFTTSFSVVTAYARKFGMLMM